MDNQAKTMYLIGVVLFLLTGIGFAIQGDLLAGGVFLVLFFALYILIVFCTTAPYVRESSRHF